jgi:hypothetical protein
MLGDDAEKFQKRREIYFSREIRVSRAEERRVWINDSPSSFDVLLPVLIDTDVPTYLSAVDYLTLFTNPTISKVS